MKLLQSTGDDVSLVYELSKRLVGLEESWIHYKGTPLPVTEDMKKNLELYNELKLRHMRNDYRHTVDEMKATKEVAQWSVDVNCTLRGQPPITLTWKED